MRFEEQVILPLPHPPGQVPLADEVRGTLLGSSLREIYERGRREDYFAALPPELHEAIRGLVASTWLPMDVALAHYEAVHTLGFTVEEQREMGRRVAARVQHGWAGTIIRGLRATGAVTPLRALPRFHQAWDRLIRGGGGAVYQVGPKDARIECHGFPLARVAYVRNAWTGMIESTLELLVRKCYAKEILRLRGPEKLAYHVSWV